MSYAPKNEGTRFVSWGCDYIKADGFNCLRRASHEIRAGNHWRHFCWQHWKALKS